MVEPATASPSGKHLLFITELFILGGVETLIARVSRWLLNNGWRISVMMRRADPMALRMLPPEVRVHELGGWFKLLFFPEFAIPLLLKKGLGNIDIIFTCTGRGAWLGTMLSSFLPRHPALLCGVYTPWEFCYPELCSFANYADRLGPASFDKIIPDQSKVFMSERVRELHARSLGRSLSAANVCVLPIDTAMFKGVRRQPDRLKIVSIGRLSGFKTYNVYMIPVIRRLVDKGYPVRWDVYGSGDMESGMRRQIQDLGLQAHIRLHGSLEYDRMAEVLARAGVFVGMGTALVEAGYCRVPSIVAIAESLTPLTYGFSYGLPLGVLGEPMDDAPTLDTGDLIEKLLRMSDAEYEVEVERTWEYVQAYDQDRVFPQLGHCLERAKPCKTPYWPFLAYNTHGIYRRMGRLMKRMRSKMKGDARPAANHS